MKDWAPGPGVKGGKKMDESECEGVKRKCDGENVDLMVGGTGFGA